MYMGAYPGVGACPWILWYYTVEPLYTGYYPWDPVQVAGVLFSLRGYMHRSMVGVAYRYN